MLINFTLVLNVSDLKMIVLLCANAPNFPTSFAKTKLHLLNNYIYREKLMSFIITIIIISSSIALFSLLVLCTG